MWRVFLLASVVVAAGVAIWPAPRRPPPQERCRLGQVMHYGGNLICHDRFRTDIVGSGNNALGLARVEAMNSKSRGSSK